MAQATSPRTPLVPLVPTLREGTPPGRSASSLTPGNDVNFQVARDFIERGKAKAIGQEVVQSIQPGQQIVLETHFINSTMTPIQPKSRLTMHLAAPGSGEVTCVPARAQKSAESEKRCVSSSSSREGMNA